MVNNVIGKIIQCILWALGAAGLIVLIRTKESAARPGGRLLLFILLLILWIRYTVYLYRKYFYDREG